MGSHRNISSGTPTQSNNSKVNSPNPRSQLWALVHKYVHVLFAVFVCCFVPNRPQGRNGDGWLGGQSTKNSCTTYRIISWEPEGRYHYSRVFSIENQKGAITIDFVLYSNNALLFSMKRLWILIAPFWLSTDDMQLRASSYS